MCSFLRINVIEKYGNCFMIFGTIFTLVASYISYIRWFFSVSLSLSLSQQHLEHCQRQLLIKPGVLEPRTIYFSRHKHSFPQVLLILLIMLPNMPDNVWNDALFVSVRWCNDTIKEHVSVACLIKPQTHGSSWSSGAWKSVKFMCCHLWNMQLGTFPAVCRMFYTSASVDCRVTSQNPF